MQSSEFVSKAVDIAVKELTAVATNGEGDNKLYPIIKLL